MDLKFYFSLFLKRLHWFLLVAVIGTALGITLSRLLPPVYVARAKLVVESEQIPGSLAASTVEVQASEQLQIIRQRILTRDTLLEMANRLQIYAPLPGETPRRLQGDEMVEDLRKRIAIATTGGITRAAAQATLVDVSFDAPTPALAAAVANDVVTLILKTDVEMRTGTARQTLDFFEREVARIDRELAAQGDRILRFKEANKDALPDSLDFRRSQQSATAERQLDLQRQEAELRDRRDRMTQLRDSNSLPALPAANQTPEARQLSQLRDELAVQSVVLSAEHPRIRLLKSQLEALEKVVARQAGAGSLDAQGRELSAFDMQIATLDSQLTYITQQRTQLETQMGALQMALDATPGNAITLGTLERDYANLRNQYDQAVANKSRAETGDMIEAMSKGQRISVIEQAVPPRSPERPNRQMIALAGVAGGMVGGAGLVVLLILLSPAIRRPEDLTAKLGISAFAVLPYLETLQDRRRRRRRGLLIGLGVGVAVALLLLAVDRLYMPLDLLMLRVTAAAPAAVSVARLV